MNTSVQCLYNGPFIIIISCHNYYEVARDSPVKVARHYFKIKAFIVDLGDPRHFSSSLGGNKETLALSSSFKPMFDRKFDLFITMLQRSVFMTSHSHENRLINQGPCMKSGESYLQRLVKN